MRLIQNKIVLRNYKNDIYIYEEVDCNRKNGTLRILDDKEIVAEIVDTINQGV